MRVLAHEVNAGFAVKMVPTREYPKNVCLKRVASHRRLARDWFALASRESVKPDVVIASMPPLGLCDAARRFAADCGAVFVADVQDAWPETFERVLPGFVFSLLGMRRMAKKIYCEADGVSAVATRYVELARKYGSEAPSSVFGHCIDMSARPAREVRDDRTLRLVYIGNMSLSYDLETVVNAVSGMDGVTLDVAGNGPDVERLRALASKAENIKFHGYLEESQLANLLLLCDVGLIPMFPDSCVGVPGKIADYAAAGLMVIESLGGETGAIVDRFDVGGHYKAGDVDSLRHAIEDLRSRRPQGRFDEFAATFDARVVMPKYVDWISSVVGCGA
jgi:glycosyltransferase involved in cell wall biosynthesis